MRGEARLPQLLIDQRQTDLFHGLTVRQMVCLGQIDGRDTTLGRETCLFDNLKSLVLQILSYGFSLKFALCFKNIAGLGIPLYRRLQNFFENLLVDLLVSSRPLAGLIFCCPLGVPPC